MAELRPLAPAAYQRGDLRLRWQRAVHDVLLRRPAHLSGPPVLWPLGRVHVLGLADRHRRRRHHAADGIHQQQGIRGTRMADRHPDHAGLGRLRHRVLRHDHQAPVQAHLRGQLVLRLVHPDHRHPAHLQQHRNAGVVVEVIFGVFRRPGRHGAVVVRA
ncbi:hypothetical protein G6F22_017653 [Rhizopus arrhizus]|nr:hypothetical protein G6F22_017653 [Rhizopus arrhizus]